MKIKSSFSSFAILLLVATVLYYGIVLTRDISPWQIISGAGSSLKKLLPAKKWPYPVVDSGYNVTCELTYAGCIRWIDNERVLFIGLANRSEFQLAENVIPKDETAPIYLWEVKSNRMTRIADQAFLRDFCAADDGYIAYVRPSTPGYVIQVEGYIGQLTERQVKIQSPEERDKEMSRKFQDGTLVLRNRFSCREQLIPKGIYPRGISYGGSVFQLHPPYGYLYWGALEEWKQPLTYVSQQLDKRIDLPVKRWQIDTFDYQYIPWENAYLLWGNEVSPGFTTNWPKNTPKPLTLFYPQEGRVATIEIPASALLNSTGAYRLTKRGLFFSGAQKASTYGGSQYLLVNDKAVRIFSGWLKDVHVSPNGCRIAITIRDEDKTFGMAFGVLKVIDLCKEEEK